MREWQGQPDAGTRLRYGALAALGLLVVGTMLACSGRAMPHRESLAAVQVESSTTAVAGRSVPAASAVAPSTARPQPAARRAAVALTSRGIATVEQVLAEGLHRAGASPVHLAIRGTPAAGSVRCMWRGIAHTAQQREDAIRFWLGLAPTEAIPSPSYLEVLFAAVWDTLGSDFRETAKANFLAIARGGESMDYLFLTCFADYAVTNFLLGTGTTPATVTVAYDRMDEAASYDLYVREHEAGTYGTDALQTRGAYEAGLQAQVVAAEKALSAEIGGREAVVFLAPMGAHNAIGFEAWQAVASWAVVTDDAGVVQAVRDDTPEGDPEHTQTLANLSSRITTGAAADGQSTTRATRVDQLQQKYRDLGAYGDITPGDGQTTTFTPAQPPAAPTCTNGTVIPNPGANRDLVKDCETLRALGHTLRGTTALNWHTGTALSGWPGVTTGGTPTRVTGLNLASQSLNGTLPAALGRLFALTTLNLSGNNLTGPIPAELGWLERLTDLRLSGNALTGCVPLALRTVATHDLAALARPYCQPPAPTNLAAGPPGETGVALTWTAVADAATYRVERRAAAGGAWTVQAEGLTAATHLVDGLTCGTAYAVRVRAAGDGTTYAAAWSAPSATVAVTTASCTPPVFDAASYAFRLVEAAPAGTVAGTVTASDAGGQAVTYTIRAGNPDGRFAIHPVTGEVTLAAALDQPAGTAFALTVAATDPGGSAATAAVTLTVEAYSVDYDADDDGLLEVASLAQLDAIRWDLDGDGVATHPGYAAAFPDAPAGMGCPAGGCTGYELTRDLDFDTSGVGTVTAADAYWHGGAGWAPLGAAGGPAFTATLDGNGHAIAHLVIARPTTAEVGLLGQLGRGGVLRNLELRAVDVTGGHQTGGLVGENIRGTIHASSVSGRVTGQRAVGGLVGWHVGGTITASTASSAVTGRDTWVGGLVGINIQGAITASYARGPVTGGSIVGGLVGDNQGTISASYARGAVTGTGTLGGLVGTGAGTVTASYWDTTTSGQAASACGAGHPTAALQAPTAATGLYAAWDLDLDGDGAGDAPWDFGTTAQYPVLQVDANGDGQATWQELGAQRDANRAPAFAEGAATRTVAEGTAEGVHIGAPLTATDPDPDDRLTYALGGADAASFGLDSTTGQLKTRAALDYETRTRYAVTVTARDAAGAQAALAVTITVTNAPDTPPPPPQNVAVTPAATSLALSWDAVAGAGTYRVETRASGTTAWTTAADDLTTTAHIVAELSCNAAYEAQVSAYGDGTTHAAEWGAASAALAAATGACPPPVFAAAPYRFSVNEAATVDTLAGTVTATTSSADPVAYALTAGNAAGHFAIHASTGALTVAGALDHAATPTYTLTVQAGAGGTSATTDVTVTVTARVVNPRPALAPPTDITVTSPAPGDLTVSWGGSANATSFVLFADQVDGDASQQAFLGADARTHTFTGLAAGTYQVTVVAQQTVGDHYQDLNATSAQVDVAGAS